MKKIEELNILYFMAFTLFLVSIPLIGKEREILRIIPLGYLTFIFYKKKVKISLRRVRKIMMLNILMIYFMIIFRNKDLLTYIYICYINIFFYKYKKKYFEKKLLKATLFFISLYLLGYILKIISFGVTSYRNRIYFKFLGKAIVMGAPFWGNIIYSLIILILLNKNNIKNKIISILLISFYYIYFDGRGPVVSVFIFLVLNFLINNKIIRTQVFFLLKIIFPLYMITSIYFPIIYKNNKVINALTSGRVNNWLWLLKEKNIEGLFFISSIKETNTIIDNSYLHFIYGSGIFLGTIIMIVIQYSLFQTAKRKLYMEAIFIISFLTYCFLESILFRYENFTTILFWYIIFKNIKLKKRGIIKYERNHISRRIRN